MLPLFGLTLSTAHQLVPLRYRPLSEDDVHQSVNYFGFVEALVLVALSTAPSDIPDDEMVTGICGTLTSIISKVKELQFITVCHEYGGYTKFPPLSRFLALLRDSHVLDSRLGYHEAARIFLDKYKEDNSHAHFEDVLMVCIPILAALLPAEKGESFVVTQIKKTFYKTHTPGRVASHR